MNECSFAICIALRAAASNVLFIICFWRWYVNNVINLDYMRAGGGLKRQIIIDLGIT